MDLRRPRQSVPSLPGRQVPQISSSMTPAQRYQADSMRMNRARIALSQKMMSERSSLGTLPDDIRTAYTEMNVQIRDVAISMRSQDSSLIEPKFQAFEQALSMIEKYVGLNSEN